MNESDSQDITSNQPRRSLPAIRLWWAIVLGVIGGLLLVGSFIKPLKPGVSPTNTYPSPTWAAFPTREPELETIPTLSATAKAEYELRVALLMGNLETALTQWDFLQEQDAFTAQTWYLGSVLAIQQSDFSSAEVRMLNALELSPENSSFWRTLGFIYHQTGASDASLQCIDIASAYDSDDGASIQHFDELWLTAIDANDTGRLLDLALVHIQEIPDSPMNSYYQAKALMLNREYTLTIHSLIDVISPTGRASALVWYTLGEAYMKVGVYQQAASVFEVATSLYAQGDTTLDIGLNSPLDELNWNLAQAYYFTDRCAEAESVFRRWEDSHIDAASWISQAVICQTPTPSPTPWILSQQSTPTP